MEISLTSLGSSHTFLRPQSRTEAASRFCSFNDTMVIAPKGFLRRRVTAYVDLANNELINLAYFTENASDHECVFLKPANLREAQVHICITSH